MNYWEAIILALIEGLTEFLPVSSTGHMIIGSSLMGIASEDFTKIFTVCIQFGAILSVVVLYYKRFLQSLQFYYKLVVAFIPAAVFGLLLSDIIDQLLENVLVVAIMLFVGGVIFILLDKWFEKSENNPDREIQYPEALKIGFFQVIAMVPGVSRSAATIIGGLTQKLNKKQAAEFSFFLAVPTMLAAGSKTLLDYFMDGNTFTAEQWKILAFGNMVAFIVAIVAIKTFIGFLTKHGFKLFGYYRIVLGLILIGLYLAGIDLKVV